MRPHLIRLTVVAMVATFAPVLPLVASPASASTGTGDGVSYTLEGCRASTDAYIAPNVFTCPDDAYTTGNLLKGWNEFDLVPGRVTVDAGNSAPATQTVQFVIAVDNCSTGDGATGCATGRPGYDRLSSNSGGTPDLNTSLSSGTCGTISASGPLYAAPGIGGTGTTLYRVITITGLAKNSTCVYDWFARLAFNSHLYPGSSLHFNLANADLGTAGIGAKDVSIPVKEILPPGFSKTQTSSQGSSVVWTLTKSSTPANFTFRETCPAGANPQSQAVTVTITWTKQTTAAGNITVLAVISLQNNAHRSIDAHVSDQLYTGLVPAAGNEVGAPVLTNVTLAAGASTSFTDTFSVPAGTATDFSDRATATFFDTFFQEPLGSATAVASSSVQTLPPSSGATAVITDTESMTGSTDYDFTVDSVTGVTGSFSNYPTLGVHTRGPVNWSSGTQSGGGSTTFNKRVFVNAPTTGTATLADTATITPAGQAPTSQSASSVASSNATVSLTINKTIPVVLGAGDSTQTFTFPVTGPSSASPTISFGTGEGGALNPKSVTLTGLAPGTYTVNETTLAPYAPQSPQTVPINLPTCSGAATFTNNFGPASAQARKVTVPAGSEAGWELILNGPGTPAGGEHVFTTGTAFVPFATVLQEGSYTITEVLKPGFDQTGASTECSFTVNYPADADRVFSCTLTNTQRGHVTVLKTENGGVPTHAYTFTLTGGPDNVSLTRTTSAGNGGQLDFGLLKPGTYTLCELAVPAGTHSTLEDQGGVVNPTTGDICLTFTLAAGQSRAFTIDNSFPLGGQRTIGYWKNWNSCSGTGNDRVAMALKTGNHLMDEFLPLSLGNYVVDTCTKGLAVLKAASGKYAENQLAAQLLGAKLNIAAGASTCTQVNNAIAHADALLVQIGYTGPPSSKVGSNHPLRADFLATASTLDQYNNGLIC